MLEAGCVCAEQPPVLYHRASFVCDAPFNCDVCSHASLYLGQLTSSYVPRTGISIRIFWAYEDSRNGKVSISRIKGIFFGLSH